MTNSYPLAVSMRILPSLKFARYGVLGSCTINIKVATKMLGQPPIGNVVKLGVDIDRIETEALDDSSVIKLTRYTEYRQRK